MSFKDYLTERDNQYDIPVFFDEDHYRDATMGKLEGKSYVYVIVYHKFPKAFVWHTHYDSTGAGISVPQEDWSRGYNGAFKSVLDKNGYKELDLSEEADVVWNGKLPSFPEIEKMREQS